MTKENTREKIYFHAGLHKTASTFLQRNVFPKFQDIHYIKKHEFKYRDKIIKHSGATKFLLSRETNFERESGLNKIKDVAEKYPGASSVLVLRNHASWLCSRYKYYIRKHGYKDFHEYFDLENNHGIIKSE